jgi:hypothetical protein
MKDFYYFFRKLTRIITIHSVLLALKSPLYGQSVLLFVKKSNKRTKCPL